VTQAEARAKLFTLKVTGRLVPLDDILVLTQAMGYEWAGSFGPAAGDPKAEYVFKTAAGGFFRPRQRLDTEFEAHCPVDGCGAAHKSWANYSAAKENDDPLVSICEAGHSYEHGEGATVWKVCKIEERPMRSEEE
jgi:hypothetical protein